MYGIRAAFNKMRPGSQLVQEDFLPLHLQVFLTGCHTAPYMPLRLIDFQDVADFLRQMMIDLRKTFCEIFMYSRY